MMCFLWPQMLPTIEFVQGLLASCFLCTQLLKNEDVKRLILMYFFWPQSPQHLKMSKDYWYWFFCPHVSKDCWGWVSSALEWSRSLNLSKDFWWWVSSSLSCCWRLNLSKDCWRCFSSVLSPLDVWTCWRTVDTVYTAHRCRWCLKVSKNCWWYFFRCSQSPRRLKLLKFFPFPQVAPKIEGDGALLMMFIHWP